MQIFNRNFGSIIFLGILSAFLFQNDLLAQHRGDNLSYQGIYYPNEINAKAVAMGGAFTSINDGVGSLTWNPAGLAGLTKIQATVSGNYNTNFWSENQEYRPDRFFVTLPFYLEGLYTPDPKYNGVWDYQLADSADYNVNIPVMGKDPYSKDAADWQKSKNSFSFNNIAVAVPLDISGKKIVVSAGFNQQYNVQDFDRNDTYLSPMIGDFEYGGNISRVTGQDTLHMEWYKYLRQRSGTLYNVSAAVAYSVNEYIDLGIKANILWGKTDDLLELNQFGIFDLADQNRFRFFFANNNNQTTGTSNFSSIGFSLGGILKLNRFNFGVNVDLPYTLERKWDYSVIHSDSISSNTIKKSGTDKADFPAIFTFGVSFRPNDYFTFAIDYEAASFSKASFNLASTDTSFRNWVNQNSFRFGGEYKATKYLSLLAGYRSISVPFVPDGAAITDRGPSSDSYTFGFSLTLLGGRFDASYEIRRLKYYDSYYSNTNYNLITYNNLIVGYTYNF